MNSISRAFFDSYPISFISQAFPPAPRFTERNISDLQGKVCYAWPHIATVFSLMNCQSSLFHQVYIVTGGNTGVGKDVAQILYSRHARVFVAARSQDKALQAIDSVKKTHPDSAGSLEFLHLDLADLRTIKASAETFLSKADRLDVLFNNAGVMNPAMGSKTAQGYDLQLGVNNIGTFMFTKLLTPLLISTAKTAPTATVRVVWVSSSAAEGMAPKCGVPMDNLDYHKSESNMYRYAVSKAGNYYHATEFAKRYQHEGVISVALNPGNLNSDLWRTSGPVAAWFLRTFILHPVIHGAYTELFAGLADEVAGKNGAWSEYPLNPLVPRYIH